VVATTKEGISMEIFWTSKDIQDKVDGFDPYWKRSGSMNEDW